MKRIILFALPYLLLLAACKDQDELEPRETGYILAGETGLGIISEEFPSPIGIDGSSLTGASYELLLDSISDLKITLAATQYAGSSSGYSYNHAKSFGFGSGMNIEFGLFTVYDSIWLCEEWNLDSTEQHVYHFNAAAGSFCQNAKTLESIDTLRVPLAHSIDDSIHSNLHWSSDRFDFAFFHSDFEVRYDSALTILDETKTRADHWQNLGRRYVAFRWKNAGIWKYGYVEVEVVGDAFLKIYGYGVER